MGRRKERRLAAISAAGRRVKLDLFAEPSGDVGVSSPKDEIGGDGDSKSHAKLPSSPSSSGPQPVNPLLLLEQYSDDEMDGGSSERHNHVATEDASITSVDERKMAASDETEDKENNHGKEENPMGHLDPSEKLDKGSTAEIDFYDLQEQTSKVEEIASPRATDPVGDVSSCWKMVLHEESGQYYYWNIATGETSWKIPDVWPQASNTTTEKIIEDIEREADDAIVSCKSTKSLDVEEVDMACRNLSMTNTSDQADQGMKADGSNEGINGVSVADEKCDGGDTSQSSEASLPDRRCGESGEGAGYSDHSFDLIVRCENLLERLNTMTRLNDLPEGQDLKKYTVEIETRLADIKALATYELSLLPFWLHSEGQIKRLEASVDDIGQFSNSRALCESGSAVELHEGRNEKTEIGQSEKKAQFALAETHTQYAFRKPNHEANGNSDAIARYVHGNTEENQLENEITGNTEENQVFSIPTLQSNEDIDMDVDMEVDDTSSADVHYLTSSEQLNVHCTFGNQASLVPGEVLGVTPPGQDWIPPPPSDDEPFPPPPPDDEPFPPPPPDEPPESEHSPISHRGSVQTLSYPEYTLSYSGSNLGYYGQTTLQLPGTVTYTHPEAGQLVTPLPHYYEAATNIFNGAPPVANTVEPTTYYGLQNGTPNPVPLARGVLESSCTMSEPALSTVDSGRVGIMDYHPEVGSDFGVQAYLCVVKSGDTTVKAPSEDDHFSTAAPETSSVVSSTSDITTLIPTAAASSKSQSKVPRGKKRTVAVVSTLRSNKKVSSLVDKWKAAKEELQEREEEPEDALEILERKRQREIEEWRAQQIANGETKENANFQPLGGDWRERVKRKRAERVKENNQSSPDVATDGNQKPDLVELYKGLPSGWQVYWDDSSKQAYYGNVLTSETTWVRPTD